MASEARATGRRVAALSSMLIDGLVMLQLLLGKNINHQYGLLYVASHHPDQGSAMSSGIFIFFQQVSYFHWGATILC
jgi:hypothetical protein